MGTLFRLDNVTLENFLLTQKRADRGSLWVRKRPEMARQIQNRFSLNAPPSGHSSTSGGGQSSSRSRDHRPKRANIGIQCRRVKEVNKFVGFGSTGPDFQAGMVTIKFESVLASFKGKLESSLVRFLAHDCLAGPRQRRAF